MAGDEREENARPPLDKSGKRKKKMKDTPYTLPEDSQLLAFLHHKKSADLPADSYVVSHKNVETKAVEAEIQAAGQPDASAVLMKQLRSGAGGRGRGKQRGQGSGSIFSRARYVNEVRQLSRWRLLLGQKRDACIQLDQQHDIERQKLFQIKHQLKECEEALEAFLAEEHAASMALLTQADAELAHTIELSDQRDALSRRYGHTRLEVYHWEERWRTVRACQRFILRITAKAKSEPNEPDSKRELEGYGEEEYYEEEPTSWETSPVQTLVSSGDLGEAASLQSLIAAFEREANSLPELPLHTPEELGLTRAEDLVRIFRSIELQNLSALLHLESLSGPMLDMLGRIDVAEGRVRREIDDVLGDIERLEGAIVREERRANQLEMDCARLVQQSFRQLICSEPALRLRALVEDAYEGCVAANEAGLEPLAMAEALESAYESLSAQLDLLPAQLVASCEREGFLRELKENREAEDAARKFELMHRLLAALRRMMEPSEPKRRRLVRRSPPRSARQPHRGSKADNKASASTREAHLGLFSKGCGNEKPTDDKEIKGGSVKSA